MFKKDLALVKISKFMNWDPSIAIQWWEGGLDEKAQQQLDKELAEKTFFNCDGDDPSCYSAMFTELNILDAEEIVALGLPEPITKRFFCAWGDGYHIGEDKRANTDEVDLDFFEEDNGFSPEDIETISDLSLGGSRQLSGVTDIMSVVRVR